MRILGLCPVAALAVWSLQGQTHPLQELIEAARTRSPKLKELVWGQEFLFAIESEKPATVSIDKQPLLAMNNVPGTKYRYKLMTLRLGTTHNYNYIVDGRSVAS